jgi:hypothetical protein
MLLTETRNHSLGPPLRATRAENGRMSIDNAGYSRRRPSRTWVQPYDPSVEVGRRGLDVDRGHDHQHVGAYRCRMRARLRQFRSLSGMAGPWSNGRPSGRQWRTSQRSVHLQTNDK